MTVVLKIAQKHNEICFPHEDFEKFSEFCKELNGLVVFQSVQQICNNVVKCGFSFVKNINTENVSNIICSDEKVLLLKKEFDSIYKTQEHSEHYDFNVSLKDFRFEFNDFSEALASLKVVAENGVVDPSRIDSVSYLFSLMLYDNVPYDTLNKVISQLSEYVFGTDSFKFDLLSYNRSANSKTLAKIDVYVENYNH